MNPVVLEHLTEQAEKARTEAARLLAEERHNKQKIAQQLATLQHYRQDYAVQLQAQLQQGLAGHLLQNYQRFLASLEAAIQRAEQALTTQQQKVDQQQQHWLQQQRTLASYETLQERQHQAALHQMNQREQKLNDELSIAMYLRNRASQ